jgi:hypothetical protein
VYQIAETSTHHKLRKIEKLTEKERQTMERETLEEFIRQLDDMIATFMQTVVIGAHSAREAEVCELLKDARRKLIDLRYTTME